MREDIELSKIFISAINCVILIGIPFMMLWHVRKAKKAEHASKEWISQILFVIAYCVAITAEIPALWSRYLAYYVYDIKMPDIIYTLSSWDRLLHMCMYPAFFLASFTVSSNYVLQKVKDILT